MAGSCHEFRKSFCQDEQAPTPETAHLGRPILSGITTTYSGRVLHVQWSRFSLRRPVFSKSVGLCPLRQGIDGAAARSVASDEFGRSAAQSSGGDAFLASIQLFHHEGHESKSRLAGAERHF